MKLSRINLNLLVVLDILLQEKHVTKASEKLHVTQSTVSSALNQLRELFNDELLIREKNQMVLTPKAENLAKKLHLCLNQLQNTISNEIGFNPQTAEITFRLAMDDCLECLLLPELNQYLSQHAPKIKCEILHATAISENLFLKSEAIDLAIGSLNHNSHFLKHEKLYVEHFVCAARKDHPLLKHPLTLTDYLQSEHLSLTSPLAQAHDITDLALSKLRETRNITLNVTHTSTALYLLVSSNLLATLPYTFFRKAQPLLDLSCQELPFTVEDIPIYQVWHAQTDIDLSHRWLREVVKNILQPQLQ